MPFSVFVISSIFLIAADPNALPTAMDINNLSNDSKRIYESFFQQSLMLRLEYEFAGKFFTDIDSEIISSLSQKAIDDLNAIETRQKKFKQQIEDYEGSDWEKLFGTTGLWRKLTQDFFYTSAVNCQISFYNAVSQSNKSKRIEILKSILKKIEALEHTVNYRPLKLVKANVLGELSAADLIYRPLARMEFDSIEKAGQIDCLYFQAAIEKIKYFGEEKTGQVEQLEKKLPENECSKDSELVLSLAILQYRLGKKDAFSQTIGQNPQLRETAGSLLLNYISTLPSNEKIIEKIDLFDAELIAQSILKVNANKYKTILNKFADKFRTPLVFYAAALANFNTEPNKTVDYLIQSSVLQKRQKSENLKLEPLNIAGRAISCAFDFYDEKKVVSSTVQKAYENYYELSNGNTTGQIDYLYASVLFDSSEAEKGEKILRVLAAKNTDYFSFRAKLDLIERKIKKAKGIADNNSLTELENFISQNINSNDNLKRLACEAADFYCRLILNSKDSQQLSKIINIIDAKLARYEPNLSVYKAFALQKSDRFDESASSLLTAFRPGRCEYSQQAVGLLSQVVEKIDYLQDESKDFKKVTADCVKLAENCLNCPDYKNSIKVKLLWAELMITSAQKDEPNIEKIEKTLSSIELVNTLDCDLLRCKARLSARKGELEQASLIWSQVCKLQDKLAAQALQKTEQWWQGKFYELYCWSMLEKTNPEDVVHTIEVLEKTYSSRPAFWAKKLNLLKEKSSLQVSK